MHLLSSIWFALVLACLFVFLPAWEEPTWAPQVQFLCIYLQYTLGIDQSIGCIRNWWASPNSAGGPWQWCVPRWVWYLRALLLPCFALCPWCQQEAVHKPLTPMHPDKPCLRSCFDAVKWLVRVMPVEIKSDLGVASVLYRCTWLLGSSPTTEAGALQAPSFWRSDWPDPEHPEMVGI